MTDHPTPEAVLDALRAVGVRALAAGEGLGQALGVVNFAPQRLERLLRFGSGRQVVGLFQELERFASRLCGGAAALAGGELPELAHGVARCLGARGLARCRCRLQFLGRPLQSL